MCRHALIPALLFAVFALAALPAHADPVITFSLDSYVLYGAPDGTPDPDSCLSSNCVLFIGTITDSGDPNDPPGTYSYASDFNPAYTTDTPNFDNVLTLDTYFSPPGLISDDPNWSTDGNLPNTYYGPIFAVDVPAGTPNGIYSDTVYIDFANQYNGDITTISATVTVIIPEPAPAGLLLVGLLPFAAWLGVRRKWRSREASH